MPFNEEPARAAADVSAGELARARAVYEGAWNFWNGVWAVLSVLAFIVLVGACLLLENHSPRPGGGRQCERACSLRSSGAE